MKTKINKLEKLIKNIIGIKLNKKYSANKIINKMNMNETTYDFYNEFLNYK